MSLNRVLVVLLIAVTGLLLLAVAFAVHERGSAKRWKSVALYWRAMANNFKQAAQRALRARDFRGNKTMVAPQFHAPRRVGSGSKSSSSSSDDSGSGSDR